MNSRWHLLQISDVLDAEMASALGENVEVLGWAPRRNIFAALAGSSQDSGTYENGWKRLTFPALRGFTKAPRWLNRYFLRRLSNRIRRCARSPQDVLVCTVPYFAEVAELWSGPVVYWLTDLIAEYGSARGLDIPSLDRRMCKAATLVCPNSRRIAAYLQKQGCDSQKILVLPNATRTKSVLPAPLRRPERSRSAGEQRPVAGVIGNMAGNLDWCMLEDAVQATPWLTWLFVGPVDMSIPDAAHARARTHVRAMENAIFVGKQPYADLGAFARSFSVAILPYRACEPTYSGSSTRYYEHLAACRPMIATRGFDELLDKEPLLSLVDSAHEMVCRLEDLQRREFDDGHAHGRWVASKSGTWQVRASAMRQALECRLSGLPAATVSRAQVGPTQSDTDSVPAQEAVSTESNLA